MPTIYDVAKLSETSIATVSYVLNGKAEEKRIPQATQEKVLKSAAALNYRANTTAKKLQSRQHSEVTLGLFWPNESFDHPFSSVMSAVREYTRIWPAAFEVSFQFYEPSKLESKKALLTSQIYDGVIIAGAAGDDLPFLESLGLTMPVVLVNRKYDAFAYARSDQSAAGRLAADLSIARGGADIAAVLEKQFRIGVGMRSRAFTERCAERQIDLSDRVFTCESTPESGYELGVRLSRMSTLPKVIFATSEDTARGLLTAFNEMGISVGREIFLLTANLGPNSFCRFMTPSLTSIDMRLKDVYENALKIVLALINHDSSVTSQVTVQPVINFRTSFPEIAL